MRHRFLIAAASMFLLAGTAFSQQTDNTSNPDWVRPDNPTSSDSSGTSNGLTPAQIDARIIQYGIQSGTLADTVQAVEYAERLVAAGEVSSSDSGFVKLVEQLATQGTGAQDRTGNRISNDFPTVRARAVSLLGALGGDEARKAAIRVLVTDPSALVQAEAVRVLANLIDVPTVDERNAITLVMVRNNRSVHDDYLAYQAVTTVEALYKRDRRPETPGIEGGRYVAPDMRNPELYQAIVDIALGPYNAAVRSRALAVIQMIRNDT